MMNRGVMDRQMFRKGGAAFPDLSGDGEISREDILIGRGVIPMQEGGNPALEAAGFGSSAGRAAAMNAAAALPAAGLGSSAGRAAAMNAAAALPAAGLGSSAARTAAMEAGVNAATEAFIKAVGRPPESLEELQSFALEMGRRVQAADLPRMPQGEIDLLERSLPSSELPPPVQLTPEYFQDMMPSSPRMPQGEIDLLDRRRASPPSSELPPPVQLTPEYFQDMMPRQGESYYPPEVRDEGSGYADGGMVMPSDMGAMAQQMPAAAAAMSPPEQEAVVGAMQASGGPEVQQMIASEAQSYGDPETAESYEEMMNMVRGDQATVEERREELAMLVGREDAKKTPESVLALVQPIVQLSLVEEVMAPGDNVDAGVGALAAQEMTTPVQGDMAGGVMALAGGAEPQMQGMA